MSRVRMNNGPTLEFLLSFYEYFLRGSTLTEVAAALDTHKGQLRVWIDRYPELQQAKALAEKRRKETDSFGNYVFKYLSPKAKKLWERIKYWEGHEDAHDRVQELMIGQHQRMKQEIFLHAMLNYSFNKSEACRIAGVSRAQMQNWVQDDQHFRNLVAEIEEHKKDFFEQALCDLVDMRNPGAVMFVNRTKNADRGYTERVEVNHSGHVTMGFDISELNLPIETRKEILEAVREKRLKDAKTIDIEPKQIAAKVEPAKPRETADISD